MSAKPKTQLLASTVALSLSMAGGAAQAATPTTATTPAVNRSGAGGASARGCPVSHASLTKALDTAVGTTSSGSNDQMWAVVVDRGGVVCRVAFSGKSVFDQVLLGRQIAAAKAFTANGLSLDVGTGGGPLSTAQLYPLVQPGGSAFGLAFGNPLDPTVAYRGSVSQFGTPNDPLIGHRVGGTITFGGGLALYRHKSKAVGGLGLSGGTACADDEIARKVRDLLGMTPSQPDTIKFGTGKGEHAPCG
jgi:uncharacterized protein GlcG (DUF336 family)